MPSLEHYTWASSSKTYYSLYLDSADQQYLVGNLKTDETGKAKTFINPALKDKWNSASSHLFILKEGDEEIISDYTINKARIDIDTLNTDGVRSITATVLQLQDNEWVPVPDVEVKVGVQRMGGILQAMKTCTQLIPPALLLLTLLNWIYQETQKEITH